MVPPITTEQLKNGAVSNAACAVAVSAELFVCLMKGKNNVKLEMKLS